MWSKHDFINHLRRNIYVVKAAYSIKRWEFKPKWHVISSRSLGPPSNLFPIDFSDQEVLLFRTARRKNSTLFISVINGDRLTMVSPCVLNFSRLVRFLLGIIVSNCFLRLHSVCPNKGSISFEKVFSAKSRLTLYPNKNLFHAKAERNGMTWTEWEFKIFHWRSTSCSLDNMINVGRLKIETINRDNLSQPSCWPLRAKNFNLNNVVSCLNLSAIQPDKYAGVLCI